MLRRLVLALVLACAIFPAVPAAARTPLVQRLAATLATSDLTAALAVDLRTSRAVYAQNDRLPLVPASNEKLPLTYAALVVLGPSYRFRTEVLGEGRLEGKVWRGDLVLKGYGDPTLSRWGLRSLAFQLRGVGIRRVTGSIVADESWFDTRRTAPGWRPGFYLEESPALSALVVDRGLGRGRPTERSALVAGQLFRRALRRVGVAAAGDVKVARGGGFPLASLYSPSLDRILRFMNTDSDNFTAEMLLKQLGAVAAGRGTTATGGAVVRGVLAAVRVPLDGCRIVDGSGLSGLDRLTAKALVTILMRAWAHPELRPYFVGALAVAGRTGTLEERMRRPPARGNVLAKTGTLRIASALAGYVKDRYAFAVIQNGHPVATWAARAAQDRFATLLASQ